MTAFVNGLDNFPRLFVIQTVQSDLRDSTASASAVVELQLVVGSRLTAVVPANAPPLWVGGTPTAPTAGPYSL